MAKINVINNATGQLTVDPGASGDSFIQFDINGTGEFRIGVDDDDSDKFKISAGSALGVNDTLVITSSGEITQPLNSAFLAYLGTSDTSVTGDGTAFTLGSGNALTEVFDQNSDFNTNGTFTAPILGRYWISAMLQLNDIGSHTSAEIKIDASNRDWISGISDPSVWDASGDISLRICALVDMDASDTATIVVTVSGSTKTVDVISNAAATNFCGKLVC